MERNNYYGFRVMAALFVCLFSGLLAPAGRAAGIYAVKYVDGIVWYTTGAGEAVRFDSVTGTKAVVPESCTDGGLAGISAVGADDVWFGSLLSPKVFHYDGSGIEMVDLHPAMNRFLCPEVNASSDGTLWVSAFTQVAVREGGDWTGYGVYSYSSAPLHCRGIQVDAEGRAWFVHQRGGSAGFVCCTPGVGCRAICSTNPQLFIGRFNDSFRSLAIDGDDVKWVGTEQSAVIRYRDENDMGVVELPTGGDATLHVTAIRPCGDGNVMVSAGRSLYVIDAESNATASGVSVPVSAGTINDFDGDGNRWWIGTSSGELYEWVDGEMTMVAASAGVDGIQADSESEGAPAAVYDITGRRVESTVPGNLYISEGRKFIAQ